MENNELLNHFISAHFVKDKGNSINLLYDGDIGSLGGCIDSSLAESWYNLNHKMFDYKEIKMKFLGEVIDITVPIFVKKELSPKEYTSIKSVYIRAINNYMKQAIVSDRRGNIISKLMENLDVIIHDGYVGFYEKVPFDSNEIEFKKTRNDVRFDNSEFHYDVSGQGDINRYENILLLLKEVKDGYYDVRSHSLVEKQNGALIQQNYKMGKDIKVVVDKDNNILEVDQKETEYDAVKQKDGWKILTPKYFLIEEEIEILLKKGDEQGAAKLLKKQKDEVIPVEQFTPYKIEENKGTKTIYMYGAYTHVLRDILDFTPLGWQYNFLVNQNRLSFVAGSRRIGKCVSPTSRIRMYDGSFKLAKDIQPGDKLLASDKKSYTTVWDTDIFSKKKLKITLDNGMTKIVSNDHRIPTQHTYSKDGWSMDMDLYKTAEQLTNKDFIPVMNNIGIDENISIEELHEAKLVGYILGDGCRQGGCLDSNHSIISVHQEGILSKIKKYIEDIGYKYNYNIEKNLISILDNGYIKKKYNGLNELSHNKYIDNNIFSKGSKFKWGVIDGLINTDGCIMFRNPKNKDGYIRKGNILIEFCSISEQLARDYQLLLADVGVVSYIRKKKIYTKWNKTKEYSWNVFISDIESIRKVFNNCDLTGKTNYTKCTEFLKDGTLYSNSNIGVIPKEAANESQLTTRDNPKPRYNFQRRKASQYGLEHWNNYTWHKVVDVEEVGEGDVIHIEVDGDSTYWVDGVLTHNTLLSFYLIVRELWRMPSSVKHIQRTIKSMYIAPAEDKLKEVVDYIKEATKTIRILKVLDFNKSENRLYLYDEMVARNQKTQIAVSSCDFVSAKGYEPGRGKASDFIVIDEAAFVPEDVWLNILPILGNERAKFYAISTIEWKSMRNWFYEQLVDAEMGYDSEGFGMRVTIDDIENLLIDEPDKERMKRALKHEPQRYYAELYATFPNAHSVFSSEGFFNISKEKPFGEQVGGIIIGYDPAKRADTGAVLVGEMRYGKNNNYIQLIEEYGLRTDYTQQKEFVQNLKQSYVQQGIPCYLIMDVTGVGEAVSEIFGNIVDYKVLYTAKGVRPVIDNWGAWKTPKTLLVHGTQILMERDTIKAYVGLSNLMDEMKHFKAITTNAGNTRYEAESGHDDYVNSMLLISFWYNYIEGNIYNISSGNEINKEGINPLTGLFQPYSERRTGRRVKLKGDSYGFGF